MAGKSWLLCFKFPMQAYGGFDINLYQFRSNPYKLTDSDLDLKDDQMG